MLLLSRRFLRSRRASQPALAATLAQRWLWRLPLSLSLWQHHSARYQQYSVVARGRETNGWLGELIRLVDCLASRPAGQPGGRAKLPCRRSPMVRVVLVSRVRRPVGPQAADSSQYWPLNIKWASESSPDSQLQLRTELAPFARPPNLVLPLLLLRWRRRRRRRRPTSLCLWLIRLARNSSCCFACA